MKMLKSSAIVLAIYLVLALLVTYPLVVQLDTHVPGRGVDDPALAWNLWWVKYSLFNLGANPLSTDYLFYPLGINLVSFTATWLNAVIALPVQLTFGVIIANNAVVIFALVVGGFGTFLLAREILSRREIGPRDNRNTNLAAGLAGAFYAFGAWHINYVGAGHVNLLSNEWLPFYTLCLIRAHRATGVNGVLAGLFFGMTAWTEITFVPFLFILSALRLVYLVIAARAALNRRWLVNFGTFACVAVLGISPLLLNLLADTIRYGYYLAPGLGRMQVFSAEPISFFVPSAQHPVLGAWANGVTNANTSYVFVGYAVLILAAVGSFFRTSRFWSAAAIVFALLSLGPTLIVGGQSTDLPLPFAVLRAIPLVNANRYPVRLNVMLMLSLTPLLALGATRLLQTRRGTIGLGGLVALLAFEQLVIPIPVFDSRVPTIFQTIRAEPGDFSILDLPLGWRNSVTIQGKIDYAAQFLQTVHQKHLIGGQTSRNPAFKYQYFLELPVINSLIALENGIAIDDARRAQDRAVAPEVVRFFDIRYVEAHRALTAPQVLAYAREIFALTEIFRDDTRIVYRVNLAAAAPRAINPGGETARLYFDDGWGRAQFSPAGFDYLWATRNDARVWLPLARAEQSITVRLRGAYAGQKISLRVNGQGLAELTLADEWDEYTVRLPASLAHDGLNEFIFETATVPMRVTPQDNYAIGETGYVSPVDIAATGAGYDAGRFGEIFVAGKNMIENQRGYHLVAVNPQSGAVDRVAVFDTFADAAESARLAEFVEQLPHGEIVAGVAVDDVSQKLQPEAIAALGQLGVEGDLRFQFRAGHAFVGVKGASPGQALEQARGRLLANVAVGKNVASARVAFALAEIRWEADGR